MDINDINHKNEFYVPLNNAKISRNDVELEKADLKVGNIVSITYGGGGSFITIGYLTDENGIREIETDWTNHYGKLETGEYRIIKGVYDNSQEYENYEDGIRYFSTEFIIE